MVNAAFLLHQTELVEIGTNYPKMREFGGEHDSFYQSVFYSNKLPSTSKTTQSKYIYMDDCEEHQEKLCSKYSNQPMVVVANGERFMGGDALLVLNNEEHRQSGVRDTKKSYFKGTRIFSAESNLAIYKYSVPLEAISEKFK